MSNDFKVGKNAGRKYEEKVVASIGDTKQINILDDPKAKKLLENIERSETDILKLIREDVVSEMDVSGLKQFVDPSIKFSSPSKEEVDNKKEGDVLIFPNFSGGKYIGGKSYVFTQGKGIYVPTDVRDVLSRGGKILLK